MGCDGAGRPVNAGDGGFVALPFAARFSYTTRSFRTAVCRQSQFLTVSNIVNCLESAPLNEIQPVHFGVVCGAKERTTAR